MLLTVAEGGTSDHVTEHAANNTCEEESRVLSVLVHLHGEHHETLFAQVSV